VQRSRHFKSGKHAGDAVELAAGWLRIQMAAEANRRQTVVATLPAGGDVADLIHGDLAAEGTALRRQPVARLLIGIAERETCDAASRGSAEARRLTDGGPKPGAVYP
jgi:hypothetical protein